MILPAAEASLAYDDPAGPLDQIVHARPPQRSSYAEKVAVVPPGEDDPIKGALLTAVRLKLLDGLDSSMVFGAFAAHLAGFRDAVEEGRIRDRQRLATR